MPTAISIENVSKQYRLGQVGTGTISHDLNRWWAKARGKEDPYSKVGQVNQRDQAADGDYVWALKDINLKVEQGEVLGIIGANGAGKSTLLKLISRITSPTTGAIKAKGRIASLLEVGTGMHPEMTARENIYLNGAIMGMRRYEITRKFDDIVDFAGCKMYVDTPVKRFSSGMRVRLAFAVAAFLEPEILIVDEVLAVGDAEFQDKALGKMRDVSSSEGRTILFVSHNMSAVENLCQTGVVMHNGKIELMDDVATTVRAHLRREVNESSYWRNNGEHSSLIRSATLKNANGAVTGTFLAGEDIIFEIKHSLPETLSDPDLVIIISSELGHPITHVNTKFSCNLKKKIALNGVVICRFLRNRVIPGRYQVTFRITSHGKDRIAEYPSILSFDVEGGDFYGTGKMPRSNFGVFLSDCQWGFEK